MIEKKLDTENSEWVLIAENEDEAQRVKKMDL